jgi:hypothetical protein
MGYGGQKGSTGGEGLRLLCLLLGERVCEGGREGGAIQGDACLCCHLYEGLISLRLQLLLWKLLRLRLRLLGLCKK